jgi:hypothetical protein
MLASQVCEPHRAAWRMLGSQVWEPQLAPALSSRCGLMLCVLHRRASKPQRVQERQFHWQWPFALVYRRQSCSASCRRSRDSPPSHPRNSTGGRPAMMLGPAERLVKHSSLHVWGEGRMVSVSPGWLSPPRASLAVQGRRPSRPSRPTSHGVWGGGGQCGVAAPAAAPRWRRGKERRCRRCLSAT